MKSYYVYMVASANNRALYTGITSDLERRLYEHENGTIEGFTKRYQCHKLVHYEVYEDPVTAIEREGEIKGWVRRRKNELVDKFNPEWKNVAKEWLDPSAQALQDDGVGVAFHDKRRDPENAHPDLTRYQRQMALPEIGARGQERLRAAHVVFLGAGGLGAPALPYLAGAGIGRITIIDNDAVDLLNLHRQTVYKTSEIGRGKAEALAEYLRALNPEIEVAVVTERFQSGGDEAIFDGVDLIIDGSDNFTTKSLLNDISVRRGMPLISASVNQWAGQCGIFAGFAANGPCYHCLFPELPAFARNCNEAGILGTSAGLAGMIEAHLALLYLLGMEEAGTVLTMDFKALRIHKLRLEKNPDCAVCAGGKNITKPQKKEKTPMIEIIPMDELKTREHLIVDVRTAAEIAADPIPAALHMELTSIPSRHGELPKDRLLAFVCAGNVRSVQAANYLAGMGYDNVCVLDKFSL